MSSQTELECKKFCVRRCLFAVTFGIAIQCILLNIYLLCINFSLFHPIDWILTTLDCLFTFYTWLMMMPLILVIALYGIFLGNSYLSVTKYYASRAAWLYGTSLRKLLSFALHGLLGFLTAYLYSTFLSDEQLSMLVKCEEKYCFDERFKFLMWSGIFAGLYYFFKEQCLKEPEIIFPVVQECKYIRIRLQLYSIIYKSFTESFIPVLCYAMVYWMLNWIFADTSYVRYEQSGPFSSFVSLALSIRLLFYTWIVTSQIVANMYLLNICFIVVLTTEERFLIEKGSGLCPQEGVTIVEALSLSRVPAAQHLASFDLFTLANAKSSERRSQVFTLSIPGGHPYNWNHLSAQCLSMIDHFTAELSESLKGLQVTPSYLQKNIKRAIPPATEAAERILTRQYNESFGIRNMMSPMSSGSCRSQSTASVPQNPCDRINETLDQFVQVFHDGVRAIFHNTPGLFYLFGEQEGAKTTFLLSQSQDVIWLTQALAGLCAASITEDRYGVVQKELPTIIRSFLMLKAELDRICNLNLNGKKLDRNCTALRNAVKRSLYKICTVFGEYLGDLIGDVDELRRIQCYVGYLET